MKVPTSTCTLAKEAPEFILQTARLAVGAFKGSGKDWAGCADLPSKSDPNIRGSPWAYSCAETGVLKALPA